MAEDYVENDTSHVDNTIRTVKKFNGWSALVVAMDNRSHLDGLKRQRGGIGSMALDEGQKKLDAFFKPQRKD